MVSSLSGGETPSGSVRFADALRFVIINRLLEKSGKLAIKKRIFIHFLGNRFFGAIGDGVGLCPLGAHTIHFLLKCLALENVDGFDHLYHFVGLHISVQQLLDLFLVITVVDLFRVAELNACPQLLEKCGVLFIAFHFLRRRVGNPVNARGSQF